MKKDNPNLDELNRALLKHTCVRSFHLDMDLKNLLTRIDDDQVKFLSLQFTDVTGAVKSLDIPVSRAEGAVQEASYRSSACAERGFRRKRPATQG